MPAWTKGEFPYEIRRVGRLALVYFIRTVSHGLGRPQRANVRTWPTAAA